jgi:hypothetical protein
MRFHGAPYVVGVSVEKPEESEEQPRHLIGSL